MFLKIKGISTGIIIYTATTCVHINISINLYYKNLVALGTTDIDNNILAKQTVKNKTILHRNITFISII